MTNDIAIKVENLGKKYQIGESQAKYHTLRDSLTDLFSGKLLRRREAGAEKEFWALRDVSFEIKQGEIVGIIGRNGAGKSTLLKNLARITEPTTGTIDLYGRVGSLLEVGTGFHQELTGRENVYLSGSILGMRKAEIDRHFDEIVDFAEVEKFIDTPVKHYSSGMYLRLAFGVAAFLQPEILLVDEVLAVGDLAFQKKCLGKMNDVAKQGRTVLFVSHNLSAVQDLCTRGILIDKGRVGFDGDVTKCIGEYYERNNASAAADAAGETQKPLLIHDLKINDSYSPAVAIGDGFEVTVSITGRQIDNPALFLIVENVTGLQVIHAKMRSRELGVETLDGTYEVRLTLPPLWLSSGVYSVYLKAVAQNFGISQRFDSERLMLEVQGEFDSTGRTVLSPAVAWEMTNKQINTLRETELSVAG